MDFENLIVYQKAKELNRIINEEVLTLSSLDKIIKDQLRRASFSIVLNIAEGCSRFSKADRKKFYIISRGSTFESVAGIETIKLGIIDQKVVKRIKDLAEEVSKMLNVMIKQPEF